MWGQVLALLRARTPLGAVAPIRSRMPAPAVDTATEENGCLGVLPGAHKRGPLSHVRVTDDFVVEEDEYDFDDMVLAPIFAGSGLFFHSLLPHYTCQFVWLPSNWQTAHGSRI